MTIEEAIIILQENNPFMGDSTSRNLSRAMDMAVDALKAEKTGKWSRESTPSTMYFYRYRCSVCDWTSEEATKYCCHCGARMELRIEDGE